MGLIRIFAAVAVAALVAGCASLLEGEKPISLPWDRATAPALLPDRGPLPTRTGEELQEMELNPKLARPDWGLAMSGGGLRSATFNVGVMKALYDAGLMGKMDIISSVSGGGYAAYWLYVNDIQIPGPRAPSGLARSIRMYSKKGCASLERPVISSPIAGSSGA